MVWKNGQPWVDIKTHMGYSQEAYDTGTGRQMPSGVPGAGRADEWRGLTVLEYMVNIG